MFGKSRKTLSAFKVKLFNIQWYPGNKSCVSAGNGKAQPQQMPPLMVRKAQWRR
ncbi:MAG: hypothetical protein ACYSSI_06030 [Planctomycetota bacterium]